jgi:hypothetical protein
MYVYLRNAYNSLCCLMWCFVFLPFCLAAAERQRLAKEVATALKLSVAIDTSLSERLVHFTRLIFAQNKNNISLAHYYFCGVYC